MTARVAVVIPYFQREAGILARALRSIVAQVGDIVPAQILIVDDGSPVPAAGELLSLPPEWRDRIQLVTEKNAGPGAARNVALNLVGDDIDYVAFLDSDDEWIPEHLAEACAALDLGFDIFFGDHPATGNPQSGWIALNMPQAAHFPALPAGGECRRFEGDLATQILRSNPIAMPTAVYRYSAYRDARFPTDFPTAEVNVFWLQLALRGASAVVSTRLHARLGQGVNVYRGNQKHTAASLQVLHNSTRFRAVALREFQLTQAQRETARERLDTYAERFAGELAPMLRHPQRIPWRTVFRQCRIAPHTVVALFRSLASRLRDS
jgi:succinoglycan biosynthesis protein ExoW